MPSTNNPSSGDSVSRSMPFHPVGCHHERSNNRYSLLSPRCRKKINSRGWRGNGTELHEDTELPVAVGRRNDGRNGGDTCGRRRTTNAVMCVPSAGRGGRVENNNVSYSKTSSSSAVNERYCREIPMGNDRGMDWKAWHINNVNVFSNKLSANFLSKSFFHIDSKFCNNSSVSSSR